MKRITIAGLALVLAACPALARDIDFSTQLREYDGKPVVDSQGKPVDMSLGSLCAKALLANYPDEQNLKPEDKYARGKMVDRLFDKNGEPAKNVYLSADDVAKLKALVGKAYPPLIVRQAWDLLDPPPDAK